MADSAEVHCTPTADAGGFAALLRALIAGRHVVVLPGGPPGDAGDGTPLPPPAPLTGTLTFAGRPGPPGSAGLAADRLRAALAVSADDRLTISRLRTASDIYLALAAWQAGAELRFAAWDPDSGPLDWVGACARNRSTLAALDQERMLRVATDLRDRPENFDLSALRVLLADNGAGPLGSEALRVFNDTAMEYGFDEMAICSVYHAGAVWPAAVMAPGVLWRCRVVDRQALAAGRWAETLGEGAEVVGLGSPLPGLEIRGHGDGELGPLEVVEADGGRWPGGDVGICVQGEVYLVTPDREPARA